MNSFFSRSLSLLTSYVNAYTVIFLPSVSQGTREFLVLLQRDCRFYRTGIGWKGAYMAAELVVKEDEYGV
jgi:hypothetical protein